MRLNALWVEGCLSYIERVCLASAVHMGHDVVLYTYGKVEDVPPGVDVRNAEAVMPRKYMIKNRQSDSYALGANTFRYFLQRQNLGCYIDCDVLFVRKLDLSGDYILGWESDHRINNAVLKLPANSPMLDDLLNHALSRPVVAPWWRTSKRVRQRVLSYVGLDRPVEAMEWGILGPRAVTYFARKHDVIRDVQPIEVFYPLLYADAADIFRPDRSIEDVITEKTIAIHLWNNAIKPMRNIPPQPGSYIYCACERFGVADFRCALAA